MQKENQEEIQLLDGRVRLVLPIRGGLRPSLDSVVVAAAVPAKPGDRILDLGCGIGTAGLCLAARVTGVHLTGVDIQDDLIACARANAMLHRSALDGAEFVTSDLVAYATEERRGSFDHIVCNPPYLEAGTYLNSPDAGRDRALGHDGSEHSLQDWVRVMHHLVRSRGSVTIIHRADHLDRLLQAMGKRFGAVEIIPLWPHVGEAARRVIVRAMKDRRDPAKLHAGIVLHEKDGSWTVAASAILRDAHALLGEDVHHVG